MLYTTLKRIKGCGPCGQRPKDDGSIVGWLKLLAHLGKKYSDNEPLGFYVILDSNGIADALWCLRSLDGYAREIRLHLCDYVEHVLPFYLREYPDDNRPHHAVEVARKFACSKATQEELYTAYLGAFAAADAAYLAARTCTSLSGPLSTSRSVHATYAFGYTADAAAEVALGTVIATYPSALAVSAAGEIAMSNATQTASCARAKEREWQTEHFRAWLETVNNFDEIKNEPDRRRDL